MMRKTRLGENVYMLGGALSGFAASACCVGPLVLMGLGIGGVVGTGAFEALAPYRPFFIIMSAVLLSLAFHRLYLAPRDCVVGGMCADPHTLRIKRGLWWLVSGISLVSIAFA
jgi:mercuric ion transport protein